MKEYELQIDCVVEMPDGFSTSGDLAEEIADFMAGLMASYGGQFGGEVRLELFDGDKEAESEAGEKQS